MSENISINGNPTLKNVLEAVQKADPAKSKIYGQMDDISSARLFADLFRNHIR